MGILAECPPRGLQKASSDVRAHAKLPAQAQAQARQPVPTEARPASAIFQCLIHADDQHSFAASSHKSNPIPPEMPKFPVARLETACNLLLASRYVGRSGRFRVEGPFACDAARGVTIAAPGRCAARWSVFGRARKLWGRGVEIVNLPRRRSWLRASCICAQRCGRHVAERAAGSIVATFGSPDTLGAISGYAPT